MDVDRGRFQTRDSNEGIASRPLSLNGFIYGEDAPTDNIDPLGGFSRKLLGTFIHAQIGKADFEPSKPKGVRLYNRTVKTIRGDSNWLYETLCWNCRPDLVDKETHEVWEIKPKGQFRRGAKEVKEYVDQLNDKDPDQPWHVAKDSSYVPASPPSRHIECRVRCVANQLGGGVQYDLVDEAKLDQQVVDLGIDAVMLLISATTAVRQLNSAGPADPTLAPGGGAPMLPGSSGFGGVTGGLL